MPDRDKDRSIRIHPLPFYLRSTAGEEAIIRRATNRYYSLRKERLVRAALNILAPPASA